MSHQLPDRLTDGLVTGAQLARRAQERLATVQATLADAGRVSALGDLVSTENVQGVWDALDLDRRRVVIDALMAVTLLPPGRGARVFRPESVAIEWRTA